MHSSPSTVEISQALARFQNSCTGAIKDGTNPAFKSKYASLDAIWSAIREPLTTNGLSVTQMGDWQDGTELLVTTIWHISGEWISGVQPVYAEQTTRNQHQAHGSAMTYLRRYALAAALGIASQDDDDAESAVAPSEKYQKVPEKYQKVPPSDKTPPTPSDQQQVKNFVDHVCNMEPTGQMIGDACKRVGADSLETVPANKRRDVIADISNQLSQAIGG